MEPATRIGYQFVCIHHHVEGRMTSLSANWEVGKHQRAQLSPWAKPVESLVDSRIPRYPVVDDNFVLLYVIMSFITRRIVHGRPTVARLNRTIFREAAESKPARKIYELTILATVLFETESVLCWREEYCRQSVSDDIRARNPCCSVGSSFLWSTNNDNLSASKVARGL